MKHIKNSSKFYCEDWRHIGQKQVSNSRKGIGSESKQPHPPTTSSQIWKKLWISLESSVGIMLGCYNISLEFWVSSPVLYILVHSTAMDTQIHNSHGPTCALYVSSQLWAWSIFARHSFSIPNNSRQYGVTAVGKLSFCLTFCRDFCLHTKSYKQKKLILFCCSALLAKYMKVFISLKCQVWVEASFLK